MTTGPDNRFTGRVRWVQIDVDEAAEDADHVISTEERLRVAMARKVDTPPSLKDKVVYGGRLNAQKALAAIGSLVD